MSAHIKNPTTLSGSLIIANTIPIAAVVGTAMDLTTDQNVDGVKTFSSAPVCSGASIGTNTIPIASVVGTAMDLTTAQTVLGTKTFNTGISLGSSATLSIAANPATGYVLTSDASGNANWAAPINELSATVTTSDATATTLISVTVSSNSAVIISGLVIGSRITDHAHSSACFFTVAVTRSSVGTLSILGSPTLNAFKTGSSTTSVTVATTTSAVLIQVTGLAVTAFRWNATYRTVVSDMS